MKTTGIIFLLFLSSTSFSQNDFGKSIEMKKVSLKNEEATKVQAYNKGQYVFGGNKKLIEVKTVAYYDNYIQSIKTKMEYVEGNKNEYEKAFNSGWFDEMKMNIANAEMEKRKLVIEK